MTAILPGRFDPPTLAHIALIRRASALFDTVTIAVASDEAGTLLPLAQRMALLRECLGDLGVSIVEQGGSDEDIAIALAGNIIVRGLRPVDAFALPNDSPVETVYLPADPATSHIRTRLVRDIIRLGGDPSPFVPDEVLQSLKGCKL